MLCKCSVMKIIVFFKHKTAYEMRINDWISDVCSSNLLEGARDVIISVRVDPDLLQRAGIRKRVGNRRGVVGIHLKIGELVGIGGHVGAQAAAHQRRLRAGLEAEIGRASWRERVCQYV